MTILNSKQLYEKYGTNTRFYKLTNEQEIHNNLEYKTGVNIDILPFNPSKSCRPGGMYFFSEPNLFRFMRYVSQPYYMREVTFDELSLIYEDDDNFKTNRFILGERVNWREYFNSDPSLMYEAVKYNPCSITYVDEQTEKLCLMAVSKDAFSIQYIKNPSLEVVREAIKNNALVIANPNLNIKKEYLTEDLYIEAIRRDPTIICNQNIQTYNRCLEAVRNNPCMIYYIDDKYKTNDLYITALSKDGYILKQIENKTYELCRIAVYNCGLALKWVPEQTQELCDLAVKQDISAFYLVEDRFKTYDMCMYVVKKDGLQLALIDRQTNEMCKEAVKQNFYAYRYVKKDKEPEPCVDNKLLIAICKENIDDIIRYIPYGTRKLKDMSWLELAKNYNNILITDLLTTYKYE